MKRYMLLSVFIILGVVASYSCKGGNAGDEAGIPKIVNVQPERGPLVLSVSSTGSIASNLDVEIKCKASGQVISLPFDISDEVKQGDLVVELDPTDEQRNVKIAQVSLSSSRARLKQAEQSLVIAESELVNAVKKAEVNLESARTRAADERTKADRMKQLYEQKLVGLEEYQTAETSAIQAEANLETAKIQLADLQVEEAALENKRQDVVLARSNVETSQISLSIAEQRLEDTKVYAPIDGVVTDRFVQTGQIISSGISNTGGGTPVLTLSDLSRLFVLASVDESDIGNVRDGQRVRVTADAYSAMGFSGVVERIAQRGVNQSNVVTFEVRIEVTSENKSLLKPEMTANVDIIVAEKEDALTVPVGAVSRIKGVYSVNVLKADGSTEVREVEVGINNGEVMEIVSGLSENDTVVINEGDAFSQWGREGGPPGGGNPMRMLGGRGR